MRGKREGEEGKRRGGGCRESDKSDRGKERIKREKEKKEKATVFYPC